MKSGLEGRNNRRRARVHRHDAVVSMKSGLEGRNNADRRHSGPLGAPVSMKSGLEGRNNVVFRCLCSSRKRSLNEVRPRRPEQLADGSSPLTRGQRRLNEVRPRRPEQLT